jgi:hypothetical protein
MEDTLGTNNNLLSISLIAALFLLVFFVGLGIAILEDLLLWGILIVVGGCIALIVGLKIVLRHPYIILGIYGADLHKVLVNVLPLISGNPRAWDSYVQLVDYIIAGAACATLALAILFGRARWKRWFVSIPVLSQLALVGLRFGGLLQTPDRFSLLMFAQFIGGNFLLLLMPVALCTNEKQVRRIWHIWLAMALILAAVSVWLLGKGAVWLGTRNRWVGLSNIRTGRVCAIAFVYLVVAGFRPELGFWGRKWRQLALIVLAVAVLTAGSKAAVMGLLIVLVIYLLLFAGRRSTWASALGAGFLGLWILLFLAWDPFDLDALTRLGQWAGSVESRILMALYYFERGLDSPFLGSGIKSSYGGPSMIRAHNVSLELFVQVGLLGPLLFLLFVTTTLIQGWQALRMTHDRQRQRLITATLLACILAAFMSQITGDIIGNRDLWFFSGLVLALLPSSKIVSEY